LKVVRDGGEVAFLISLGCHPNLVNGPFMTSDFPGRIRPSLEERMGRPVKFFFLQGFGGNVRPDVLTSKPSFWRNTKSWIVETVEGRSFEKQATEAKLREVGKHLANKILSIPFDSYKEIKGGIEVSEREVRLPLQSVSSEGAPGAKGHESEEEPGIRDRKQNASVSIQIKRIRMGEELSFIAIPGEVFCEYSLKIKNLFAPESVLPLGCTDGMVGYLPTQKDFQEGGYEPGRAYKLFGLPSPFTDEIERVILAGANGLKFPTSQG
jgi:hypothetical protein